MARLQKDNRIVTVSDAEVARYRALGYHAVGEKPKVDVKAIADFEKMKAELDADRKKLDAEKAELQANTQKLSEAIKAFDAEKAEFAKMQNAAKK